MRRFGVVALLALVCASAGRASNTATFADPKGDSGNAPDIGAVTVSNDNQGVVEFSLEVANRSLTLEPADFVQIYVDADGAPFTGQQGFELAIQVGADGGGFFRFEDGTFKPADAPSLRWQFAWNPGQAMWTLLVQIGFRDLGSEELTFFAYADTTPASADEFYDFAPANSNWDYSVKIPLLTDKFDQPKPAKAGKAFDVDVFVVTDDQVAPSTRCSAKIGSKRVSGIAGWFSIILLGPRPPGGAISIQTSIGYRGLVSCRFKVPRAAKGKKIAGTIVATKEGVTVRQAFSAPIR